MDLTLSQKTLTVFHDGSCALCGKETAFYRRRSGAEKISWQDVSKDGSAQVALGLSRDTAMERIHVQLANGDLAHGGDAFFALWRELPAFRVPVILLGLPGMRFLVNKAYNGFLRIRPWLQRVVSKHDDNVEMTKMAAQ